MRSSDRVSLTLPRARNPPHATLHPFHSALYARDKLSVPHNPLLIPSGNKLLAPCTEFGNLGLLRELRDLDALHLGQQRAQLGAEGWVRDGRIVHDGSQGGDGARKGGGEGEHGRAEGGCVELRRRLCGIGSEEAGMGAVCKMEVSVSDARFVVANREVGRVQSFRMSAYTRKRETRLEKRRSRWAIDSTVESEDACGVGSELEP